LRIAVRDDLSQVGGGAYPVLNLPTRVITLKPDKGSAHQLEKRLREGKPPIIARLSKDEVLLDVRTIGDDEGDLIAAGIEGGLKQAP